MSALNVALGLLFVCLFFTTGCAIHASWHLRKQVRQRTTQGDR